MLLVTNGVSLEKAANMCVEMFLLPTQNKRVRKISKGFMKLVYGPCGSYHYAYVCVSESF